VVLCTVVLRFKHTGRQNVGGPAPVKRTGIMKRFRVHNKVYLRGHVASLLAVSGALDTGKPLEGRIDHGSGRRTGTERDTDTGNDQSGSENANDLVTHVLYLSDCAGRVALRLDGSGL